MLSLGRCRLELVALKGRIADQPAKVRAELEPLIDEVLEHAMFRSRVMLIARDALQRLRVDMAALRFDLEATRRERAWPAVLLSAEARLPPLLAVLGRGLVVPALRAVEPGGDHPADFLEAFGRAVLGQVVGLVPVRIVEVDDVDGGDARLVQGEMVVHDFAARRSDLNDLALRLLGHGPDLLDDAGASSRLLGSMLDLEGLARRPCRARFRRRSAFWYGLALT